MSTDKIIEGVITLFIVGFVLVGVSALVALVLGGLALLLPVVFAVVILSIFIMCLWYGIIEVWEWIRDRFH